MYIHVTDYKFKHIYRMDTLKDYSDYCERDIKRLNELIEKVRAYQMELHAHAQEVINTPMKKVVKLQRSKNYGTNKIQYYVSLEYIPQVEKNIVDGNFIYGDSKHQKTFEGKERHLAIKYAQELSKQYHCEIERKGFNAF